MATKPLKTITFEGLDDTYTIPQIDDTLSVTGGAADAKVTGDSLKAKAEAEGMVSMAKALVGGKYTLDQSPYHYRQSPDAGALDEKIVGGTLAWNQLCNSSSVTVQTGHKYLSKIGGTYSVGSSTGTAITGLTSGTDMVFDLTTLFGSTIADYIYSLETATAGAGVSKLKEWGFFTEDYYEYCEPTLKSVEGLQSKKTVGFNQWDEEWRNGYYNPITGVFVSSNRYICSKNAIPVLPSTTYYIKTSANEFEICELDANKNFLRQLRSGIIDATFDTNADTHYIQIGSHVADKIISYDPLTKPICINLSDPTRNGQYEPYESHSYPLDSSVVLRGVPKLDSNNNLYYDGDIYSADGQGKRRYGLVDLGELNWGYNQNYSCWNTSGLASLVKKHSTQSEMINNCAENYVVDPVGTLNGQNFTDGKYILGTSGNLFLKNGSTTTPPTGLFLYELATPTTFTAQPYHNPQIVGDTEKFVTTGIVPVGHESKYYEDVAKKVSGLPKDFSTLIAPVEKSFTATRNYTVGSFVIVNNQLYKVSSAISSGGTITPNSNVTATTIMAEILALA